MVRAEVDRSKPPPRSIRHLTPVFLVPIATTYNEYLFAIAGVIWK